MFISTQLYFFCSGLRVYETAAGLSSPTNFPQPIMCAVISMFLAGGGSIVALQSEEVYI